MSRVASWSHKCHTSVLIISIGEWTILIQWFWFRLIFHLVMCISKYPLRKWHFDSHKYTISGFIFWFTEVLFLIRSQDKNVCTMVETASDSLVEIWLYGLTILNIHLILEIVKFWPSFYDLFFCRYRNVNSFFYIVFDFE